MAATLISRRLAHRAGHSTSIKNLAAVEINAECRAELSVLPEPPECMFGDILDFAVPLVVEKLNGEDDIKRIADEVLKPGAVRRRSKCLKHGKICEYPEADLHAAGPPCIDYSPRGKRMKEAGSTAILFMI